MGIKIEIDADTTIACDRHGTDLGGNLHATDNEIKVAQCYRCIEEAKTEALRADTNSWQAQLLRNQGKQDVVTAVRGILNKQREPGDGVLAELMSYLNTFPSELVVEAPNRHATRERR